MGENALICPPREYSIAMLVLKLSPATGVLPKAIMWMFKFITPSRGCIPVVVVRPGLFKLIGGRSRKPPLEVV